MNKIFLDIETGNFTIEENLLSYKNYSLLKEYKEKVQELSGFMIIVSGKVLLVKPTKFKDVNNKWSIPKGKVGDRNKFKNALKELEEETGIILSKDIKSNTEKVNTYYKKSGQLKKLTTYIIRLNESDLDGNIDDKWEISRENIEGEEIYKAKFFTIKKAMIKIELGQLPLLRIIK